MEGAEKAIDTARERSTMLRYWLPDTGIGGLPCRSAMGPRMGSTPPSYPSCIVPAPTFPVNHLVAETLGATPIARLTYCLDEAFTDVSCAGG